MKGKIKNQLKDLLYFSIDENVATFQEQIDQQIMQYNIDEKMYLKAKINKLHIDKFALDVDRIHAFTSLSFDLETEVYDMRAFNDNSTKFRLK